MQHLEPKAGVEGEVLLLLRLEVAGDPVGVGPEVTARAAIDPRVKPLKTELVLNKTCVDPFLTTNLDQALQNADVNTIIIVGLWTNYVVEATARHASDMGYRVFLVRDACASNTIENHEFTIKNILPTLCYVVGAKELQAALK